MITTCSILNGGSVIIALAFGVMVGYLFGDIIIEKLSNVIKPKMKEEEKVDKD